jgi:hypothetical protein
MQKQINLFAQLTGIWEQRYSTIYYLSTRWEVWWFASCTSHFTIGEDPVTQPFWMNG